MAWCPKCRNEYREGIKVCADCKCELVDEEPIGDVQPLVYGNEEWMTSLKEYLEYNEIEPVVMVYKEDEGVHMLMVKKEHYEKGVKLSQVFLSNESKRQAQIQVAMMMEQASAESENGEGNIEASKETESARVAREEAIKQQMAAEQPGRIRTRGVSTAYKKNSEKAEDNRSSAWVLLVLGSLGLIAMVLGIMGIIPFSLGNPVTFYGVMCTMFIIFIVMGVVSLKSAKEYAKKAESEDSLQNTLTTWCKENLTAEKIDAGIPNIEMIAEEELYFYRFERIKGCLNGQFVNLDQTFLDHFVDTEVYEMVFGEEA